MAKRVRLWNKQEEALFLDVWESNMRSIKEKTLKQNIYLNMQKELSLHFEVSPDEIQKKIRNLRRHNQNGLVYGQSQRLNRLQWLVKKWNQLGTSNEATPDECVYTNEDLFVGAGEQTFTNVAANCNTFQTDGQIPPTDESTDYVEQSAYLAGGMLNPQHEYIQLSMQPNEDIINLDDDDDDAEYESISNNVSSVENTQCAFEPIRSVQTIAETNFLPSPTNMPTPQDLNSHLSKRTATVAEQVTLRSLLNMPSIPFQTQINLQTSTATQPSNPKRAKIPIPIAPMPPVNNIPDSNSASAFETSPDQPTQQATNSNVTTTSCKTSEVLERLDSIDRNLANFMREQDLLTRQMYREGLQHNILLSKILEQQQETTKLLAMILQNNSSN